MARCTNLLLAVPPFDDWSLENLKAPSSRTLVVALVHHVEFSMISAPRMTGEERSPLEPARKAVWVINPPLGESSGKLLGIYPYLFQESLNHNVLRVLR